jgi:hypothetical protein
MGPILPWLESADHRPDAAANAVRPECPPTGANHSLVRQAFRFSDEYVAAQASLGLDEESFDYDSLVGEKSVLAK